MKIDLSHSNWVIDRIQKYVCEHSPFSDLKILLQRNVLLIETALRYMHELTTKCTSCKCSNKLKSSRKFFLSALSLNFNDLVSIYPMFLDEMCVFYVMNSHTLYSPGLVVNNTSLDSACKAFDVWNFSTLLLPDTVFADASFW